MALPVALALSDMDEEIIIGAEQVESHRRRLIRVLNDTRVDVANPQVFRVQTNFNPSEMNQRPPRPPPGRGDDIYWALLNQVDNTALQQPNPRILGQLERIRSIATTSRPPFVPMQGTFNARWAIPSGTVRAPLPSPSRPWIMNVTSTNESIDISMPRRSINLPSSGDIRSTSDLMDYEFTHLPSTSSPWTTVQHALNDTSNHTTPQMEVEANVTPNKSSPHKRRPRRSRSASSSPPTPTRDQSPHRTPNRPRRSASTPSNVSFTITPRNKSKERKSRRNSREEPIIRYQNRDLLDLGSNLQPPAFHVNADVLLENLRSEHHTQTSGVEEIVTCTQDGCNFLFINCSM